MKQFQATAGMNWIFDLWHYLNTTAAVSGYAEAQVRIADGTLFHVSERVQLSRTVMLNGQRYSTDTITRHISDRDTAAFHRLHP